MASFLFSQQINGWQQMFRRGQSGSFLSRLFAWLMLGLLLAVGLLVVVTILMLSWLLIPVLLFKKRSALKAAREAAERAYYRRPSTQGDVIEGVVTEVDDRA